MDCVNVLSLFVRLHKHRKIPIGFYLIISNTDRHSFSKWTEQRQEQVNVLEDDTLTITHAGHRSLAMDTELNTRGA